MAITTTYSNLHDQSVFITGGATGIGSEMVKAFLKQGSKVAFIDINETACSTFTQELDNKYSGKYWMRIVDVKDVDALKNAITTAGNHFNGIDILVNNVANDMRHQPQDISPDDWQQCMQINLNPAFFAAQAVTEFMKQKNHGSIINLSSINTILGPRNMVGYTTAKAGLIGMTKSLAKDFGQFNIRVNAILPGWIATEKQLASYLNEYEEERWMDSMAIPKRIAPIEVAKLALFLASEDSSMITGQSINIDGGRT